MIGRRLGHYEIVEKLGEGGMGAVYRARDTTLGRDVALKLLPEFLTFDREKIARLDREARLLASLSHPNVATLFGLEDADGVKYLVMELVPGETLAERISRGPVGVEECLGIFHQIAEGLEAAHEKGIIHRDLKPANVIVGPEGRVKVLDFGLAKSMAEERPPSDLSKSPTLTREGTELGVILGTAAYMSPEQARGKTLDRRTDIWSFGCVFYEALTGRMAFSGETVPDILAAILEREPDWNVLPARTPVAIGNLLRRCLQKDAHRRLRDIGDARIEIEEARREPSAPKPSRKIPLAPFVLALTVVSAIAIWALVRRAEAPKGEVSRFSIHVPSEQALTWVNDPSVAISPDGRSLVYAGGAGNEQRLYLRSVDQLESRPIPGTERAFTAFFSPDGEWVGFFSAERQRVVLRKLRLDSGLPSIICAAPAAWGASWGPDDTILLAADDSAGLSRMSASGGTLSPASTLDPTQRETSHRWPEFLPGGKTALFTILTPAGPRPAGLVFSHRIGLLSLETGKHRVILENGYFARYVPTGHLVFLREGTLLAVPFDLERLELTGDPVPLIETVWTNPGAGTAHFTFSRDGTLAYVPFGSTESNLVWVDRAGVVQPIAEIRRAYRGPRLSPDGERLAVMIEGQIWFYEFARNVLVRATIGSSRDTTPLWTPDGGRFAFRRSDPSGIFWQPADGSGEAERLITSEKWQYPTSWSPDGKVLVYTEFPQDDLNLGDIGLLAVDGESRPRPFLNTPLNEAGGVVSPDGHYLAYYSNESGRYEVYVRPFPASGGKWQISSDGGVQPVWARSGREIFYRNEDRMMAVPVETEPAFRPGKPALLFTGEFLEPEATPHARYDVAPGDRFVMIQQEPRTQIHVVLNWHQELKERVPSGR
jgi:serine/threonine-protein kinase